MRVLLAPHGTRGDVQPMLALAAALHARGHVPFFVAPSNFIDWIRASGFDAESNGTDIEAAMRVLGSDRDSIRWQLRVLKEHTARLFEPLARLSEGADLIIGAGAQLATSSIAEFRGVPHASVAFCPCAIPGGATPPPAFRTQTFPSWINRLLWQVGGPIADLAIRGTINRGRASIGLAAIDSPFQHIFERGVILAADRDLAPLGDDAPAVAVCTDAWIFDEPYILDPRVDAFLNLDPAPIYVGFGSMVATLAEALSAHAVDAARAVGRPLILAGGWAGLDRYATETDVVLTVDAVPHQAVFPRVAMAVHHGGAGTTTAAARAGVPQVILPHILDQYYWAHRVERLGVGARSLPVELVTADLLADRFNAALGDPRIVERAATLSRAVRARNGANAGVDHLERMARCPV
jgi:vancomycin aglycone glucosyltransferase